MSILNLVHFYLDRKDFHNPRQSLAHMRLAAYVAANVPTFKLNLFSYEINLFSKADIKKISNASIVGFSLYMWTHEKILEIVGRLSEINPKLVIVIGGPDVAFVKKDKWPVGTIFVLGEGEIPLAEICQQYFGGVLDCNRSPASCQLDTTESKLPEDGLFLFSGEFFHRVNLKLDTRYPILWESSRGCPYQCGFCGHKQRNKSFSFNIERIKSEIIEIGRNNIKSIFIVDPILGGGYKNALTILLMFKEYAPKAKLFLYFRPEHLGEELIELMVKSNICEISFGLQTTNESIPAWVRKNNMSKVKQNLCSLRRYHIPWRLEFIIGLPGDTPEGFRQTLRFGVEMRPTWLFAYWLTYIRGTKIDGIRNSLDCDYWVKTDHKNRVIESNSYSRNEMNEMLLYGNAVCSLYNASVSLGFSYHFAQIENMVIKALIHDSEVFSRQDPVLSTQYWKDKMRNTLKSVV